MKVEQKLEKNKMIGKLVEISHRDVFARDSSELVGKLFDISDMDIWESEEAESLGICGCYHGSAKYLCSHTIILPTGGEITPNMRILFHAVKFDILENTDEVK